jgi:hypothetical protein
MALGFDLSFRVQGSGLFAEALNPPLSTPFGFRVER